MTNNIKKITASLLLASCMLLTSCSSDSNKAVREENMVMDGVSSSSSAASIEFPRTNSTTGSGEMGNVKATNATIPNTEFERKIIKNANLEMETKTFDEAIVQIVKSIEDGEGYIENQSVDGKSLQENGDYFRRNATITARVPAEKLSGIIGSLSSLYNITNQSEYINDITDDYYDVQAHLNMLKTQEAKFTELLKKADKLEDVIELEKALTDCRSQIDSLTGRMRRMDNQVSLATLKINLIEVVEYKDISTMPKTFTEKIAESFKTSGKNIVHTFSNVLFFIIEDLPTILIFVVFWGVIIYAIIRIFRMVMKKGKIRAKAPKINNDNKKPD